MENLSNLKIKLRKTLLEKRKAISQKRREEAAARALEVLKTRGTLLSFTPIGSEIDISSLNHFLKNANRLFLVPYRIDALIEAPIEKLDAILVPGLAFDSKLQRIGYGKGYYDQFLSQVKGIPKIGVGFKEQLIESVPVDPWDQPVDELLLF